MQAGESQPVEPQPVEPQPVDPEQAEIRSEYEKYTPMQRRKLTGELVKQAQKDQRQDLSFQEVYEMTSEIKKQYAGKDDHCRVYIAKHRLIERTVCVKVINHANLSKR